MPSRLRRIAYQIPKIAKKRRSQSCYCRHQCQMSKLKISKRRVLVKNQPRSRFVLPPTLQGIHFEVLLRLGLTIDTLDECEEPPDLTFA
jgi:hypothetical protein